VREADTVRALEGGADACLTEPLEAPVLVATVRALLRARHAEDELRNALERERNARESAEAANRMKDDFLATLSHELRTPLGAILIWVTLLRSGEVDETQTAHALEAIERNTRLQTKLVSDLLDVSRIISGKMVLEPTLLELQTVVEATVDSVRVAAEAKQIHFDVFVDPTVGPVAGDSARLQQVLWNLLSNAIKFTPKSGSVSLRVEGVDSQVQMTVADNGQGIAPTFLPHLFERFRQADASSTRTHAGLGLGLAIVRHLVELHGGVVNAQSSGLGHGSIFTVRLPLAAVRTAGSGATGEESTRRSARQGGSLSGLNVVVLDDDRDAREAIGAVIRAAGASVAPTMSVREALAAVALGGVDVIVSDVAMPDEDGFVLIKKLRQAGGAAGERVPAVAVTAYAGPGQSEKILAADYDAYLAKPVEPSQLIATIARLAAERSARS
jgi:signal transduction histidine kinase/ActR/RegA family two-component response regulator